VGCIDRYARLQPTGSIVQVKDGERRRRVAIEADAIAPSLRWAIARPVRVDRRPGTEDEADAPTR